VISAKPWRWRTAGQSEILRAVSQEEYLLANQPSELERLQLQSRVWEPAGLQFLSKVGGGSGGRALDVGCGALGWLRILSEWVGPSGQVVGTDIDESLLNSARSFLEAEGVSNESSWSMICSRASRSRNLSVSSMPAT
jgi:2-polyprenyl-3-methyl-5-hydroxy-6-metoxy-1,4-benzoquinol methylase